MTKQGKIFLYSSIALVAVVGSYIFISKVTKKGDDLGEPKGKDALSKSEAEDIATNIFESKNRVNDDEGKLYSNLMSIRTVKNYEFVSAIFKDKYKLSMISFIENMLTETWDSSDEIVKAKKIISNYK